MSAEERAWISDDLVRVADEAIEQTIGLRIGAMTEAIPELSSPSGVARIEGGEGTRALRRYLGILEREMERLCGHHDFRTLLVGSRICSGLRHFREYEASVQDTIARCQPADYAALAFGRRDLPDQVHRDEDGNYWFEVTESIAADIVKLHVLASEYRGVTTGLLMANFLLEFRREKNQESGSRMAPP